MDLYQNYRSKLRYGKIMVRSLYIFTRNTLPGIPIGMAGSGLVQQTVSFMN
ncbi:hypothetical protein BJX64DRAFT_141991 [Aspergillus heterothallicus]